MKSSGQPGPVGESSLVIRLKTPRKRSPVAGRTFAEANWGKLLHQCWCTASLPALEIAVMVYNDWVIPNFSNLGGTWITWRMHAWVCPICDSWLQQDSSSQTGWCQGCFSESCRDWGSPVQADAYRFCCFTSILTGTIFCLVIWLISPHLPPGLPSYTFFQSVDSITECLYFSAYTKWFFLCVVN